MKPYDANAYPFQPIIGKQSFGKKEPPLFQRLNEVIQEKNELMQNLKEKVNNENTYTFQPEINENV